MSFQITGLGRSQFDPLFALDDEALRVARATRVTVTAKPGFPCRVSLEDAEPGEEVILTHFVHQPADSPFHASHAVYVRRQADEAALSPGQLPPVFRSRTLSLRAFDTDDLIIGAELVEGEHAAEAIVRLFADPCAAYIHAHYAKFGCYAARIDRA
jgi:hypothetical protein